MASGKATIDAEVTPKFNPETYTFAEISTFLKAQFNLGGIAEIKGDAELTKQSVGFGLGASEGLAQRRANFIKETGLDYTPTAKTLSTSQLARQWFSGFYKDTWWYNGLTGFFNR